jgi:hypothetical protein
VCAKPPFALQRAEFLLDALAHQEPVGHHLAHLYDAVRSVNGLVSTAAVRFSPNPPALSEIKNTSPSLAD